MGSKILGVSEGGEGGGYERNVEKRGGGVNCMYFRSAHEGGPRDI